MITPAHIAYVNVYPGNLLILSSALPVKCIIANCIYIVNNSYIMYNFYCCLWFRTYSRKATSIWLFNVRLSCFAISSSSAFSPSGIRIEVATVFSFSMSYHSIGKFFSLYHVFILNTNSISCIMNTFRIICIHKYINSKGVQYMKRNLTKCAETGSEILKHHKNYDLTVGEICELLDTYRIEGHENTE